MGEDSPGNFTNPLTNRSFVFLHVCFLIGCLDKIAVLLPNCVEFVYCYLACMVGGYIIIPINHKIN